MSIIVVIIVIVYFLSRECLRHSVTNSEHVQVYCPFAGDDYECDEFISDREIRTVCTCVRDL